MDKISHSIKGQRRIDKTREEEWSLQYNLNEINSECVIAAFKCVFIDPLSFELCGLFSLR